MNGLDTNVLVRFLINDDKIQAEAADCYIKAAAESDTLCFINRIVLCELIWVLERGYHYSRIQIATLLDHLLRTSEFAVENADKAWQALTLYKTTNVDFSDALIGTVNRYAGCQETVTFDKKAATMEGMRLL